VIIIIIAEFQFVDFFKKCGVLRSLWTILKEYVSENVSDIIFHVVFGNLKKKITNPSAISVS